MICVCPYRAITLITDLSAVTEAAEQLSTAAKWLVGVARNFQSVHKRVIAV